VNYSIELVLLPKIEREERERFCALFDYWRRDDSAESFAEDDDAQRVDYERAESCECCAPDESNAQKPERFGFVAINPEYEQNVHGYGQRSHYQTEQGSNRPLLAVHVRQFRPGQKEREQPKQTRY